MKKTICPLIAVLLVLLIGCGGYKLPTAARIIEAQQSSADMFGDYSYCAKFKLSDAELAALRKQGFGWFPQIKEGYVSKATWGKARLPSNVVHLIEGLDVHLKSGPEPSAQYSHLYEWVDGGFWRLIAIDATEIA